MKLRSAAGIVVSLSLTFWAGTALSGPTAPPPTPTAQPVPAPPQVLTADQRRIGALEDQVKRLQAQLDQLTTRTVAAEGSLKMLATHTHTYEQIPLGSTNLATIQAHPNDIMIATRSTGPAAQGGTKTSSGPKPAQ
jgi:hypothetical protein